MSLLDVLGTVLPAIGSIGGSIIDAFSSSNTNSQNVALAREQMAYQTSEREAMQDYNKPVNQRQRYQEAGFNPYLLMNQIDAGNTQAMTSVGAPTLQAPKYGDVMRALGDSVGVAYQNQQLRQQIQMQELGLQQMAVDTKYKLQDKLLELLQKRVSIENSKMDYEQKKKSLDLLDNQIKQTQLDYEFSSKSMNDRLASLTAQRKIAELDVKAHELSNQWLEFQNSLQPEHRAVLRMQIREALSRIDLNSANAGSAVAAAALAGAQKDGVKIDNYQKNKLNWLIREGVRLDNKAKKWDTDHPSYMDRFFANSQSFDRNTGLQTNRPQWSPANPVTSSNGTTRW